MNRMVELVGGVVVLLALSSSGAQIAVPDKATTVEKTAARELSAALQRITGEPHDVLPESEAGDAAYLVYRETTSRKTLEDYLDGQIDKAADRHPTMSERQQALTSMVGKDGHGKVRYW